jgi:hypothetical protein
MNNQPVTVEQLMQAVSMLGGRPEYKQYALTDPGLLKQAYHFVRACQEELPKFVETEVTPRAALAALPPHLPDGPVVTFEQAAVQITNLVSRGAKKRFEQFLNEDLDYRAVTPLFKDHGVPEKVLNRLAQEFARWHSEKKQQTKRANAQKSRKKAKAQVSQTESRRELWSLPLEVGVEKTMSETNPSRHPNRYK